MAQVLTPAVLSLLLLLDPVNAQRYGSAQQPINDDFQYAEACPDYTQYSMYPQYVYGQIMNMNKPPGFL